MYVCENRVHFTAVGQFGVNTKSYKWMIEINTHVNNCQRPFVRNLNSSKHNTYECKDICIAVP